MGRRSTATTKSGKFMNPADQERKQLRKKELKKNKKQRVAVRQALLKAKDTDDIIEQLEKLDQIEFEAGPETTRKQVLHDKRTKLKGTYFNVMNMYRAEKELERVKDMQTKMTEYEIRRKQIEQNFEAVKFSMEADPGEIPLPDGLALMNAAMTPSLPTAIPAHLLLPEAAPKAGILKRVVRKSRLEVPPGPPCGLAPEFSDSEHEDNDGDDDDEDLIMRRKRVRFGDEEGESRKERKDDGQDATSLLPLRTSGGPIFHAIAPGALPPLPSLPPPVRMGLRAPPPPPFGKPRGAVPSIVPRPTVGPHLALIPPPTSAAVISAEPQVVKRSSATATISAQPQLRNMQKEVVRFVPTNLRVHRVQPKKPIRHIVSMGLSSGTSQVAGSRQPSQQPQKSTDDAYADFMKEMGDLL